MVVLYLLGVEEDGVELTEELWSGMKAYKQEIPFLDSENNEDDIIISSDGGNSVICGLNCLNGKAYAKGPNGTKLLGFGKSVHASSKKVSCIEKWTPIPMNKPVKQVSVGSHHSLMLTNDGMTYSCGRGDGGQLGLGPKIKNVSNFTHINNNHFHGIPCVYVATASSARRFENQSASYILGANGKIFAFGNNNFFKLGIPSHYNCQEEKQLNSSPLVSPLVNAWFPIETSSPADVQGNMLLGRDPVRFNQIAAGKHHVLALDTNGYVYAWGSGDLGRLGLDDMRHRSAPTLIPALANAMANHISTTQSKRIIFDSIIARETFSLAHSSTANRAYSWGFGTRGQIGRGHKEGLRACPAKPGSICWGGDFIIKKLIANDDAVIALTQECTNSSTRQGMHSAHYVSSHLAWGKFDFEIQGEQQASIQPQCSIHLSSQVKILSILLSTTYAFIATDKTLPTNQLASSTIDEIPALKKMRLHEAQDDAVTGQSSGQRDHPLPPSILLSTPQEQQASSSNNNNLIVPPPPPLHPLNYNNSDSNHE